MYAFKFDFVLTIRYLKMFNIVKQILYIYKSKLLPIYVYSFKFVPLIEMVKNVQRTHCNFNCKSNFWKYLYRMSGSINYIVLILFNINIRYCWNRKIKSFYNYYYINNRLSDKSYTALFSMYDFSQRLCTIWRNRVSRQIFARHTTKSDVSSQTSTT